MACGRSRDRFHALHCIDTGGSINLLTQPRNHQTAGNTYMASEVKRAHRYFSRVVLLFDFFLS
jgi:hypothetical protein